MPTASVYTRRAANTGLIAYDLSLNWQRAFTTNGTAASTFASKIPTLTAPVPSAAGVVNVRVYGVANKAVNVLLFGAGSNNNTMKFQLIGWTPTANGLWIPQILAALTGTLSAVIGVTGGDLIATDRIADTITIDTGTTNVDVSVISPTNDTVASAKIDLKGCEFIEFQAHRNSSATSVNALYKLS